MKLEKKKQHVRGAVPRRGAASSRGTEALRSAARMKVMVISENERQSPSVLRDNNGCELSFTSPS